MLYLVYTTYGMTYSHEDHIRDIKAYDRINTVQVKLKLNKKYDSDIIHKLDTVGNKQGYIKQLIRDDIGKEEP